MRNIDTEQTYLRKWHDDCPFWSKAASKNRK